MLLEIHPNNPNPRHIATVVDCLKSGGIIAYPTDTIYGLGCDIFQPKAIEKIAQIKGVDPCLLYTSPSPRDRQKSRMPSSA